MLATATVDKECEQPPCLGLRRLKLPHAGHFWIALTVALCIKTLISPVQHTTYPCFEAGTRCWFAEKNMYDVAICGFEYRYSPAFAIAFYPFACFPTALGGVLWSVFSVALLYFAIRELIAAVLPLLWTEEQKTWFSILVLIGSVRGLWAAQSNTLIIALVGLAAAAIVRRQYWRAAFLLAVPVYIKVWPVALAGLCIACWPRRLGGRFAVAMVCLAVVPFLTKSPAIVCWQYQNWFDGLLGPIQERHEYRDAWTFWETLFPPVNAGAYKILQAATGAIALALCVRQKFRTRSTQEVLTFVLGIWTAWQLVFGPGTERNTFCLIAPLTSWGLLSSLETRHNRLLMWAGFGLTTLFSFGIFERKLIHWIPLVKSALPFGVLLFATWLVLESFRSDKKLQQ